MSDPLHWQTISELAPSLRSGDLSAVQLCRAALERIEGLEPSLQSFVTVMPDAALAAAARADQELAAGRDRGPLHGVPIAIKDLCRVTGAPRTAGMRVFADDVSTQDATVVARLREAGAVILGTLKLTESAYANHHPDVEPPRNPWDAQRWAGVSSSGSGVATAAGLCVASLGTDTGGSIRFPSAVNGVVGLKPTFGRVSVHGVWPLARSLDHVGPMTRSVADAAAVLKIIAGFDENDPLSLRAPVDDYASCLGDGIAGLRIGIDERYVSDGTDAAIVGPILDCASVLREAGAELVSVTLPPWQDTVSTWAVLCAADAALAHEGLFPQRREDYGESLAGLLDLGLGLPAVEVVRATEVRDRFCAALQGLFTDVDLLLTPSMGFAIPEAVPDTDDPDVLLGLLRFTAPFDYSGSPTLSLPCGFSDDGMPLSLQLVGRHLGESVLCRAGSAFEKATDWHRRHPQLPGDPT